jgi:hypothetical protein
MERTRALLPSDPEREQGAEARKAGRAGNRTSGVPWSRGGAMDLHDGAFSLYRRSILWW